MKVILLEDVSTLGKKGQIVKVSDGYGRNFILPRKLGVEANNRNLKNLKTQRQREEDAVQKNFESAKKLCEKLSGGKVTLFIKVGEGGKAFGSVSSREIAKAVKEQLGLEVDKKKIQLKETIKVLGVHEISVKLYPSVTAVLKVEVKEET